MRVYGNLIFFVNVSVYYFPTGSLFTLHQVQTELWEAGERGGKRNSSEQVRGRISRALRCLQLFCCQTPLSENTWLGGGLCPVCNELALCQYSSQICQAPFPGLCFPVPWCPLLVVSSTLTLSEGLTTSAVMESENHQFVATLVIIGFLGDQDLTQFGRITPQLA